MRLIFSVFYICYFLVTNKNKYSNYFIDLQNNNTFIQGKSLIPRQSHDVRNFATLSASMNAIFVQLISLYYVGNKIHKPLFADVKHKISLLFRPYFSQIL